MALTTERARVAHLLRRTGFGASVAEIDAAASAGLTATIERLLTADRPDDIETRVPRAGFDFTKPREAVRWWLMRMAASEQPFIEKLTLFWHGLLTSSLARVGGRAEYMVAQNDLYRRLALGSFRELLLAAAKDAAMIRYLDNNTNRKGKPNENFARELMELFTLGIGNYSETDIREAARAFTGWFERNGEFYYVAQQHDTGAKSVLGSTGNWDGGDIITIITRQPAHPRFIVTKLWSFFAYPDPEPEIIDQLAAVYQQSDTNIRATLRALLSHPAFYSERAYHALVKSPVEFTVGFLRTLGGRTDATALLAAVATMGQTPLAPPNVAGWPGGDEWISTTGLITRYNFANAVLRAGPDQPTAIDVAGLLQAQKLTTPEQIIGFFADLLVDGDLSPAKRQVLTDYLVAGNDGKPRPFSLDQPTIDNKVRGLIYLLATTPEYQMN